MEILESSCPPWVRMGMHKTGKVPTMNTWGLAILCLLCSLVSMCCKSNGSVPQDPPMWRAKCSPPHLAHCSYPSYPSSTYSCSFGNCCCHCHLPPAFPAPRQPLCQSLYLPCSQQHTVLQAGRWTGWDILCSLACPFTFPTFPESTEVALGLVTSMWDPARAAWVAEAAVTPWGTDWDWEEADSGKSKAQQGEALPRPRLLSGTN